jgi:hypothetical protein
VGDRHLVGDGDISATSAMRTGSGSGSSQFTPHAIMYQA